jgi:hypothetical protein
VPSGDAIGPFVYSEGITYKILEHFKNSESKCPLHKRPFIISLG